MLFSGAPLHFTEDLELEIIQFLPHRGAISCTSIEGRRLVDALGEDQCCPCQQFHHPEDAVLICDSDDLNASFEYAIDVRTKLFLNEEDDDEDVFLGSNASELRKKMIENTMIWSCCGSSFYSSGCRECRDNCDVTPDEARIYISANDNERTERIEETYHRRYLQDEGDANPLCMCGRLSCICRGGYVSS